MTAKQCKKTKAKPTADKTNFSEKNLKGCFQSQTTYVILMDRGHSVAHETLYAENDEDARKEFDTWLEKKENSCFKELRQYVIVQKYTQIIITTRIA